MTATDIDPSTDLLHAPGSDRRWRESYYFSFYDPQLGLGGFTSIGKRVASGHTGSINVLWGPDRPTLVASELDTFTELTNRHVVQGLVYEPEKPFGAWRLSFDGVLNDGGSATECAAGALGPTGPDKPSVPVSYDLMFTPRGAPYVYRDRPEWSELFTGHVDEVGTVTGQVTIDGTAHEFRGLGGKDHSWGVRNWFAPNTWRWIDLTSADGPQLTLWGADFGAGVAPTDGAVYLDQEPIVVTDYLDEVETESVAGRDKPFPVGVRASFRAGERTFELTGRVLRLIPVLFTRRDCEDVSWNDRALVECRFGDGALAYGNIEFSARVGPAR